MAPRHAKSACCGALVRRFGKRRRQCSHCKRTWSVRQKKRGPKKIRTARALLARVLLDGRTLGEEERNFAEIGRSGIARRFEKALRLFVSGPAPRIPRGPYALVVDGVYFTFERREWVLYLLAVKPVRSRRMYFLDPALVKGRERLGVWDEVFEALPEQTKKQIQALVSDGLPGFPELAARRSWVYQRCHFHLLASLVRGKGMRRYRTRGSPVRDRILKAVHVLLAANVVRHLHARTALRRYANNPSCPAYARKRIMELLWREEDFRAYIAHPRLGLPATTNAMESTGRLVRKATRTARTPDSLLLRATAFLRLKQSVTCNGSCDTQK